MKTMLFAFVVIIVIAFGADYVLEGAGFSSAQRHAGSAVRLN
ncbi:MAG: hypothetical protein R3E83_07195 [Burkholderiaceae bacterium]